MYLCDLLGSRDTACDCACAELIVWPWGLLWLRSVCPRDMDSATVPASAPRAIETCSLVGAVVHH